jgi:hypothetical protein
MTPSRIRFAPGDVPAERGPIQQAVKILGVPPRTVQAMAARGEIAGAAK